MLSRLVCLIAAWALGVGYWLRIAWHRTNRPNYAQGHAE
jgi:hypothetical protein